MGDNVLSTEALTMFDALFRPTELDLALRNDPGAEAARQALLRAAGEMPASKIADRRIHSASDGRMPSEHSAAPEPT